MPMYFPDLASVQNLVKSMQKNKGDKQYKGVVPTTELELPEARKSLAKYMREIWKDDIFAFEIEMAVSEEDYDEKMREYVKKLMNTKEK